MNSEKVFKIFLIFLLICLIFGCSKKVKESFSSGSRTCCSVNDHHNCISCNAKKSVKDINDMCNKLSKENPCTRNELCVWRDQGPSNSKDKLWDNDTTKCKSIIQAGFNMNNFTKEENKKLKGSDEETPGKEYALLGQCLKKCEQDDKCKAIGFSLNRSKAKRCIIMKGTLSNDTKTRGGKFYKKKKNKK